MSHVVTWATTRSEHHQVLGASIALHRSRGQSQAPRDGITHLNKEQSPIACIGVGKGTQRTDRVPTATPQ